MCPTCRSRGNENNFLRKLDPRDDPTLDRCTAECERTPIDALTKNHAMWRVGFSGSRYPHTVCTRHSPLGSNNCLARPKDKTGHVQMFNHSELDNFGIRRDTPIDCPGPVTPIDLGCNNTIDTMQLHVQTRILWPAMAEKNTLTFDAGGR